jgi:hypothetical protein
MINSVRMRTDAVEMRDMVSLLPDEVADGVSIGILGFVDTPHRLSV